MSNKVRRVSWVVLFVGILCVAIGLYLKFRKPSLEIPPPVVRVQSNSSSQSFEIPSFRKWFDTAIDVTNKRVSIEYNSGEWSNGGDTPVYCDASGIKPDKGDGTKLLPELLYRNAVLGELIAKTDDGVFAIGRKKEIKSSRGRLYLSMNDKPEAFDDNLGSIKVTVTVYSDAPTASASVLPQSELEITGFWNSLQA